MIVLKVLAIIAIVLVALFLLTLVIYFFNLDMKTTLKTWTVAQALMAVIGFIGAYAIYLLAS